MLVVVVDLRGGRSGTGWLGVGDLELSPAEVVCAEAFDKLVDLRHWGEGALGGRIADGRRRRRLLGIGQQPALVFVYDGTVRRGVDDRLRLGSAKVVAGQANGKVKCLAKVRSHDEVSLISKPKETNGRERMPGKLKRPAGTNPKKACRGSLFRRTWEILSSAQS